MAIGLGSGAAIGFANGKPDSTFGSVTAPRLLQRIGELAAGAEEFLRVHRLAVDPGLVVQVRAGRTAGGADLAEALAELDLLPDLHVDLRHVAIAGRES